MRACAPMRPQGPRRVPHRFFKILQAHGLNILEAKNLEYSRFFERANLDGGTREAWRRGSLVPLSPLQSWPRISSRCSGLVAAAAEVVLARARVCSISYADDIVLIADSPGGCSGCFTWRIATAARTGTTSSRRNAKLSCSGDTATPRLLRAKWRSPWGEPLKISPEFRYLGVQMARQVETRGAARTMAEVRRAHRQSSRRG